MSLKFVLWERVKGKTVQNIKAKQQQVFQLQPCYMRKGSSVELRDPRYRASRDIIMDPF